MKVVNQQAKFDYEIIDRMEAGIVLSGAEAKSARLGQVAMGGAHVKVIGGELWVVNMHIHPYKFADNEGYEPTRARKLLVSSEERLVLENKMKQQRLVLVPTAMYSKGPRVKLEIGLARGKKKYEKREVMAKRDAQRDVERELRGKE